MTFDPTEHAPDSDGAGSKYLQHAGDFVVAFTRYNGRETNTNGKSYLKMSGVVIHGEPANEVVGKRFSQRLYITRESYGRIGAMCASMGWSEKFDLEDDEDCRRVLLRRPFKAKFKTETRDGTTYAGIAFFERHFTEDERAVMDEWVANAELDMDNDAPPPPTDADAPGAGDDIPF